MPEKPFIRPMFDAIAPFYDLLNRCLSMGQDIYWRRELIRSIQPDRVGILLDVACGTADVMVKMLCENPFAAAVGTDFSHAMLVRARKKLGAGSLRKRSVLVSGNALALPFEENSFDAVTIAFGIRNIANKKKAIEEFFRVLRPGGRLGILELTLPEQKFARELYLVYFTKILPVLGRMVSGHESAYSYLPESVAGFPPSPVFSGMISAAGFQEIMIKPMTFGVATLFSARKPGKQAKLKKRRENEKEKEKE